MAAIFARSCLLLGDLDSFCVGCSIYIPGDEDVMEHIQKSRHTAKTPAYNYVEKYKDDCIKKYTGVYFCEICNIVINTAARVSMHVTTDLHLERKRRQLKRVGTAIVFQNKYLISNDAWNSFVEDTCLVCDTEYEDYLLHRYDVNHLMNVVRSKVIVDGENIYRKVGGGYHCLTCNNVCSDNKIIEHLNSTAHKNAFVIFDENQDYGDKTPIESEENSRKDGAHEGDDDDENTNEGENKNENESDNTEDNTEGNEDGNKEGNEERNNEGEENQETNEDNKERDEDDKENKDKDNEENKEKDEDESKEEESKEKDEENKEGNVASGGVVAETSRTDSDMEIEPSTDESLPSCSRFSDRILYNRLTQPKEEPDPSKTIPKDVEIYARQNNLYLDRSNVTVYCNPCSHLMDAVMKSVKEHVNSKRHKENIKPRHRPISPTELMLKSRRKIEKVKMQGFVKSLHEFNIPNGNYVLVNEQFCMSTDDYMGYVSQGNKTICQLCELELTKENVELHKESHEQVMKSLFLITSLDSEFIRQVRSNLYHCGFCGKTSTSFDDMLEHVASQNHMRHKSIHLKMMKRFVATDPEYRKPVVDIMQLAKKF